MVKFSIIVPVYREMQNINVLISHVQDVFEEHNYDIVIVDGESEHTTINNIETSAANIKKMSSEAGRAIQMNKGAVAAEGRILIFLHADTFLPHAAPELILRALTEYDFGCFLIRFATRNVYIRIAAFFANMRAKIFKMPYGDNTFFLRKDVFDKLGGFKEIPVMEDVEFVKRARQSGLKLKVLEEKVLTSARRWEKEGILFYALRNLFLMTAFFLGVPPEILKKYYETEE